MLTDQIEEVKEEVAADNPETSEKKEGNEKPAWMGQLPADLKADEELSKYKTIGELAKSLKELNGKLAGSVKIPTKESKPEEVAAFLTALGRPESAEKYEFEKPMLPEGVNLDKTREADFRKMAHDLGLTQQQASALFKSEVENALTNRRSALDTLKRKSDEAEAKLKADWGADYDAKVSKAESVYRKIAEKESGISGDLKNLFATPTGKRIFAMLSEKVLDDTTIQGKNAGGDIREIDPYTGRHRLKFKEN